MEVSYLNNQQFIERLTEIITDNLSNEKFGVSELTREMGKSRSFIYRRLKMLTNHSISHFIRVVRLEKALQLLFEENLTASEIAYNVGFKSPSYFSTCFHNYFGFPPGDAKKYKVQLTSKINYPIKQEKKCKLEWIKSHSKITISVILILLLLSISYFIFDVLFNIF